MGEPLHALRRDLLYAHEGMIRARHLEFQTEQAWCLTSATNAVIAWTAESYGLAVEQMRREGPPHRRRGARSHCARTQREHQCPPETQGKTGCRSGHPWATGCEGDIAQTGEARPTA
nr:transposase [Nocardia bhagyanarayanae]